MNVFCFMIMDTCMHKCVNTCTDVSMCIDMDAFVAMKKVEQLIADMNGRGDLRAKIDQAAGVVKFLDDNEGGAGGERRWERMQCV